MNDHQKLYFDQAKSDFEIFQFLKGKPACHRLHYLQMCTEKLGKAFFFKKPPPYPSHAGFVKFLRNLSTRRNIWRALNFGRREDLELYVRGIHQIAQDVESLAPQLADDGPNPEYPWPRPPKEATTTPLHCTFPIWEKLQRTSKGFKFKGFIEKIFTIFPDYF